MSSLALKLTALIIRTVSKPIAGVIKQQAREHPRFRRICVSFAQSLHRMDMRLRLGLLRDVTAIDRQHAKDAAAAESQSKKQRLDKSDSSSSPSSSKDELKTISSTTGDKVKAKEKDKEKEKSGSKPRIRPLSEAKAIDSGANFISESFLFMVAGSLIVFEAWRSRRKENIRKEDVADRLAELEESEKNARKALVALEKEIIRLRAEGEGGKQQKAKMMHTRILPKEVWEVEEETDEGDEEKKRGFWKLLGGIFRRTEKHSGQENQTERRDANGSTTREGSSSKTPQRSHISEQESPRSSTVKS